MDRAAADSVAGESEAPDALHDLGGETLPVADATLPGPDAAADAVDAGPDAAANDVAEQADFADSAAELPLADVKVGDAAPPDADSSALPDGDVGPDAQDLGLAPDESNDVSEVEDAVGGLDSTEVMATDDSDVGSEHDSPEDDDADGATAEADPDLEVGDIAADTTELSNDDADLAADGATDATDGSVGPEIGQDGVTEPQDTTGDLASDASGDPGPDVEPICAPADCDDADPCTVDSCDPVDGCVHTVDVGAPCDDLDKCTAADACDLAGVCVGSAVSCPDSDNPCALATCDPATGACGVSAPDGTACEDDDACNGAEICLSGVCNAGVAVTVDDGDPCTLDTCDTALGPVHTPVAEGDPCLDGSIGWCVQGVCGSFLPPTSVATWLPDTGQIDCFDAVGTIACGGTESLWYGQDGDYVAPAMAYVEVTAGVLLDEVTELLWQRDAPTTPFDRLGAEIYCAELDLGEQSWRLPTRRELLTIVDYGTVGGQVAAIDPAFGPTLKSYYWTVDTSGANPDRTMRVSFKYGTSTSQHDSIVDGYVRCVAGDGAISEPRLVPVDRELGVYDPSTGLAWQRVPAGSLAWADALSHCRHLESVGQTGWRLPDVRELATLLVPEKSLPVLDTLVFPGVKAGQVFWSSTTSNDPVKADYAYLVGLGDVGDVGTGRKTDAYQVLCARTCPCPNPRCCSECEPLPDGMGCDDEDPATYADQCTAGRCVGQDTPPPPDPGYSHQCKTLDCGPRGICALEGEVQGCACEPGWQFDGVTCVVDSGWPGASPLACAELSLGTSTVCIQTSPFSDPEAEPSLEELEDIGVLPLAAASPLASKKFMLRTPRGYRTHTQNGTNTCVLQSTNAALEMTLGSSYAALSEYQLAVVTEAAVCDEHGNWLWQFFGGGVLQRLRASPDWSKDESIELNYSGATCAEVGVPIQTGAVPQAVAKLKDVQNISSGLRDGVASLMSRLDAGHPIIVDFPVYTTPNWTEFEARAGGWNVVSESWYRIARDHPISKPCHTVLIGGLRMCGSKKELTCQNQACVFGWHAVTLVGYETTGAGDPASDVFYFINSWGSDGWGQPSPKGLTPGFTDGLGKMTFGFVQNHARGAYALTKVDRVCDHICDPATSFDCDAQGKIRRCVQDPDDGCRSWAPSYISCGANQICKPGKGCVLSYTPGDGSCAPVAGENCTNSSADCSCAKAGVWSAGCADGVCACSNGICALTCTHACQANQAGCLTATSRWTCATTPQSGGCLAKVAQSCPAGQVCTGAGSCETTCVPNSQRVCKSGANEAWWADSCGALQTKIESCGAGATCLSGQCQTSCQPSAALGCHLGNVYHLDTCGQPTTLAKSCGQSGYVGSTYCSADGQSERRDYYQRGCSAGDCYDTYQPQVTACANGVCKQNACATGASTCGDSICTAGVENCATCPGDCPCWNASTPYCAAAGQCVACTQDAHCPFGSACQSGACVSGQNECPYAGLTECVGSQPRECVKQGNHNVFVNTTCGPASSCCKSYCASTIPPAPPVLVLPASGATVTGKVYFEWAQQGYDDRVMLAICKTPNLGGICILKEPEPAWPFFDVALAPGEYWWSVRSIGPCDISGWGAYSPPRQLSVQ